MWSFKWSLITGDLLNGLLVHVVFYMVSYYKWSFKWPLISGGLLYVVSYYRWSFKWGSINIAYITIGFEKKNCVL